MYLDSKYFVIIWTLVLISTTCFSGISEKNDRYELNIIANGSITNSLLYDEIDQYQTEDCGSMACIYTRYFFAQGFLPSRNILTRVELLLSRVGIKDSNFTVSIRKDLDGKDLIKIYIKGFEIETKEWITFDFQDIFVTPNEIYYIVCSCDQGCREFYIEWYYGNNNPYPNGKSMISSDNGNNWYDTDWIDQGHYDTDFCFKTYGYNDPNAYEDLSCNGDLIYKNVTAGSTQIGSFILQNIGYNGSCLDWDITKYPDWGVWKFSPQSGEDLTPSDGIKTISITLVVPEEKNAEFNDQIKVGNSNNPEDYEIIQISLTTSKSKPFFIIFEEKFPRFFNLLSNFFQ